ncbi:aldo/keto reductase [Anaerocolumna sedimenticola]|uniref:Aldo/keto reductase n=1 Tax=Anaerocolumna sedimenticola TaxID=2696063 RepID=A0A6P1TMU0_9FIRM|nr:aldo/keto reductase [Anaerocolumna sedimenticola]QHQ61637.1 aldo/keto reductase [Anaerocolumna sedimenticola]
MQYRNFGKLDFKVSALGFGAMRLPTQENENSESIDEAEAIKMIRHAIDQGVNYVDTAYGYHQGNSEILVGKALQDGYRDKVKLATKSPVWLINKPEDFERLLEEQLAKLQTDHIDFYLLHALSRDRWRNTILKQDVLKHAEAAKQAGKIRHIGFSFHDDEEAFFEIIDGYDKWEFCQIQYNYLDINEQAGMKGLKHAASKGLGVVVMEPLLGGRLANPPQDIMEILDENGIKRSPSSWALQWLWDQPEVSVVLSGMSNLQQVEDNLVSANQSGVGLFNAEDQKVIERVRTRYSERAAIPCTGCSYCMPCPNNVNIPRNFELYNGSVIHDDVEGSRNTYNNFFDEQNRASSCIGCRICEEKCPQKIVISDWMPKVHSALK